MLRFLFLMLVCVPLSAYTQDTVSIMYYNLLNFPQINSGRITHLATIMQHTKPDILVVEELTSSSGANLILNNALNINGITYYQKANYVNSPDTDRMLYYHSDKFGLVSQDEISTSIRDINEYVLYYKDPTLTAGSDTIFMYIYGVHFKAGNDASDVQERATEAQILRNHLNARSDPENTIVGGDMNIYTSAEQAYIFLTGTSGANLTDPVGTGNYHNNGAFSYIHTQCTRISTIDGGSTGGMDDRFDMIFHAPEMNSGTHGMRYIAGSHKAIGQDGLRLNDNLINPINNSEPSAVISSLYYMSDHLPVMSYYEIDSELDVRETEKPGMRIAIQDGNVDVFFETVFTGDLILRDLSGKEVYRTALSNRTTTTVGLSGMSRGIYFLEATTSNSRTVIKFAR